MQSGLRVISFQGAIEKSSLLLLQYWKFEWLDGTIIISYFGGGNDIFADCNVISFGDHYYGNENMAEVKSSWLGT